MPTRNGIDYSFSPPNVAVARSQGVLLFARYLSPSSGKDFTAAEIKEIHRVNAVGHFLWEQYATDALQGFARGATDGNNCLAAIAALQAAVGYKQKNVPGVSFAVDFDVQPSQYAAIENYFRGVRSVVGTKIRVGCYGHNKIIDHLVALKLIDFGFQTYAWSYGVVSPNAHLYQFLNGQNFAGGQVDYCQVNDFTKLGVWGAPGSKYDSPGGIDMSQFGPQHWDDADFAALAKRLATDKVLASAFHAASFGEFNKDAKGNRQQLKTWLNRIRNGQFVPLYDSKGKFVPLPPVK